MLLAETGGHAADPPAVEAAPVHVRLANEAAQIRDEEAAVGAPNDGRPPVDQLAAELRRDLIGMGLVPLQLAERDRPFEEAVLLDDSVDLVARWVQVATRLVRIEPKLDLAGIANSQRLELWRQALDHPVGILDGGGGGDRQTVAECAEDAVHRAIRERGLIAVTP